ncbi:MAG: hypothetical protein LBT09_00890 [Planctomycetaceae bacterium]|nr:hypothetical protein [Planctomycetaceae bacterium]
MNTHQPPRLNILLILENSVFVGTHDAFVGTHGVRPYVQFNKFDNHNEK